MIVVTTHVRWSGPTPAWTWCGACVASRGPEESLDRLFVMLVNHPGMSMTTNDNSNDESVLTRVHKTTSLHNDHSKFSTVDCSVPILYFGGLELPIGSGAT